MIKHIFNFFILLFVISLCAHSQEVTYKDPKGLYIQPFVTVEMLVSNETGNDSYRLFSELNGFMTLGTEIGHYEGSRSYGIQLKYGYSIDEREPDDSYIDGEKVYDDYFNIGLVANGRVIGTKTKNNFQAQIGYRAAIGYYYYRGSTYITDNEYVGEAVESISSNDHAGGIETGLNVKLGFRPTRGSAILLVLEPINLQLQTSGSGLGFIRYGLSVQF